MLVYLFVILVVVEIALAILLRITPGINPREFPSVSPELLEKHQSFDPELGWLNQPNVTRTDNSGEVPSQFSLDEDGARVDKIATASNFVISSYGDSFCFCREVNDDQTWQHYLAKRLSVRVENFGQGNHGLDQALLLMKRTFAKRPAHVVIMAVTPWSIMRILSVWKHYSEFGNVLAVKPRYVIENGFLKILKNPVASKTQLLDLSVFADYFRANDFHYRNYFLKHQVRFPRFFYLFQDRLIARKFASELVLGLLYAMRLKQHVNSFHMVRSEFELAYKKELFLREGMLFKKLMEDFTNFAIEKGFHPVLFIMPSYEDLNFMKQTGNYYKPFLENLANEVTGLSIVDLADDFFPKVDSGQDAATLFTKSKYGWPGHYNAGANYQISQYLATRLQRIVKIPALEL